MGRAINEVIQALYGDAPLYARGGARGKGLLSRLGNRRDVDVLSGGAGFSDLFVPDVFRGAGGVSAPDLGGGSVPDSGSGGSGGVTRPGGGGGSGGGGGGIPFSPQAPQPTFPGLGGAGGGSGFSGGGGGGIPATATKGMLAGRGARPISPVTSAITGPAALVDGLMNGTLRIEPGGHIVDLYGRPVGIMVNGVPTALTR